MFTRSGNGYVRGVRGVLAHKSIVMGVFVGILGLTWGLFQVVPKGFIPVQDKQYLVGLVQLPNAASLNRTDEVVRRVGDIALERSGRARRRAVPRPVDRRLHQQPELGDRVLRPRRRSRIASRSELYGLNIAKQLNMKLSAIQDAQIVVFPPPPVQGLGTIGGFKLQLEDRADLGYDELYKATQAVLAKARQTPELTGVFSNYEVSVPQISADVNRVKAKEHGIALTDVFETLQVYLGSIYVNDFNRFGRTYQVIAQADYPFRAKAEDILRLKTRNEAGEMVPLGSVVQVSQSYGPDRVFRYNGYLTADVNGGPAPGYSSGQAQAAMERILAETLPNGVKYEWTDLTYQEIIAGNSAVFVFPLCVLLVVLVLAALYESWTLPLAIVAIVPMALFSAHRRPVAHRRRQQHLHADRAVRAGRPREQERDPDRRVRQGPREGRRRAGRRGAGSGATAAAADPDDVVRVHHGRRAAGVFVGGRRGDAPRHRYRRVLRNDRRDVLRPVPDTTLLRAAARRGEVAPRTRSGHRECRRCNSCVIKSWRCCRRCCSRRAQSVPTIGDRKSRRRTSSSASMRRSSRRPTSSASSGKGSTTSS